MDQALDPEPGRLQELPELRLRTSAITASTPRLGLEKVCERRMDAVAPQCLQPLWQVRDIGTSTISLPFAADGRADQRHLMASWSLAPGA